MSKDQAIGAAILIVCVVVAIGYLVGLFGYSWITSVIPALNIASVEAVQYWLIAIPVLVGFVAILFIGAWIGFTMATTPAPKAIEEITTEIQTEDKAPEENKP